MKRLKQLAHMIDEDGLSDTMDHIMSFTDEEFNDCVTEAWDSETRTTAEKVKLDHFFTAIRDYGQHILDGQTILLNIIE